MPRNGGLPAITIFRWCENGRPVCGERTGRDDRCLSLDGESLRGLAESFLEFEVTLAVDKKHRCFRDSRWPLVDFDSIEVVECDLQCEGWVEGELGCAGQFLQAFP